MPCVKSHAKMVACKECRVELYYTTGVGAEDGEFEAFCNCSHVGRANIECHACGHDICYRNKPMVYDEAYCVTCVAKAKSPKKKSKTN